jgi:uncharacterized protein
MRRFRLAATLAAGVLVAVAMTPAAFADSTAGASADPTVDQIYAAAKAGHLDQAQQMITQVLADHPTSGRAHFVQAELYAREGKAALARSELAAAEQLKPGLPFANPAAVQELKAQIGLRTGVMTPTVIRSEPAAARFPWGTLLIFAAVIAVLFMVFRRRNTYPQYPAGMGPGAGTPGYGPGGYGPAPMGGGGIGSGIAGGLASGLAVGAGVVAGEELAHHFLDGGRSGGVIPPAEAGDAGFSNNDMGGSDFGMSDPGGGWDDSGGGGGGGDWS